MLQIKIVAHMNFNLRRCLWILLSVLGVSSAFAQPTISSFSPLSGFPGMPAQVTITGTGFSTSPGGNIVRINGTQVTAAATATTQIQISAIPIGTSTGKISVQTIAGTVQSIDNFVIGPFIESFSPISGGIGSTVVILGAQFSNSPSMTLKFAGTNAVFTRNSSSQITATVPANAMTGPLTVSTAVGAAKGTNITITNFFVPPIISSFSPPSSRAGSNITIIGRSFAGVSAVRIGNITAAIVSSDQTNIVITVPNNAATGKISVDAPPNSTLTTSNFIVLPTIVSFTPPKGRPGTNVVITGTGFNGSAANITVKFNGTTATIVGPTSINTITSTVPANATSGPITVTTTNGTATSGVNFFLPPSITSVVPSAGPVGTPVVITGVNFTNATDVSFGGVSAVFTVNNNTQITTASPAGGATGRITVTTPGGIATNATLFSYPPVITSFSPDSGLPGTNVTINGVNFTNATGVKFAGSNASFTVVNDGKITATVPANAVSGTITVTGPGGTVISSTFFFIDTVSLTVQLLTNVVSVTWPTSTLGFILQDTTNLLSTNTVWLAVTSPTVTLQNGVNTYTNIVDSSARVFRLKK